MKRTVKGLSQQALAERAKDSLGYIARLETCHYDPKAEHAAEARQGPRHLGDGPAGVA
jgi:predicted transcriptional regulator